MTFLKLYTEVFYDSNACKNTGQMMLPFCRTLRSFYAMTVLIQEIKK